MTRVLIRGDGVAARCCAQLLAQSGVATALEPVERPRLPIILLSETAQLLIRDVFCRDGLFRDLPQIRRRVAAWGPAATPRELDHSAVVLSEEELLTRLGGGAAIKGGAGIQPADVDWTICTSRPLPGPMTELRFGSRMASATAVQLEPSAKPDSCWIESVEGGWLFLMTGAPGTGWLLAVGGEPEDLLAQSRLIGGAIAQCRQASGQFASSPRIVDPLSGLAWLACGTAAMAFDPICGDGTAHAVREAILAHAVIRAGARGEDPAQLLEHYESRLVAGLHRHLSQCLPFYVDGGRGSWWRDQVESVKEGLHWCGRRLGRNHRYRYQLVGFDLRAI